MLGVLMTCMWIFMRTYIGLCCSVWRNFIHSLISFIVSLFPWHRWLAGGEWRGHLQLHLLGLPAWPCEPYHVGSPDPSPLPVQWVWLDIHIIYSAVWLCVLTRSKYLYLQSNFSITTSADLAWQPSWDHVVSNSIGFLFMYSGLANI